MEAKVLNMFCIFCFISCIQKTVNQTEKGDYAINVPEVSTFGLKTQKDSLYTNKLSNDIYYSLIFDSEMTYRISWGNKSIVNYSNKIFETLGNGNLGLINFNDNYILLGQSTGTDGANIRILLPLEKDATILEKENVLFENLRKNILVFEKTDSIYQLEILNFKSLKSQILVFDDICPAAAKSMCIDSIFLKNNQIVFHYQGNNWEANKLDNRVKVLELKY